MMANRSPPAPVFIGSTRLSTAAAATGRVDGVAAPLHHLQSGLGGERLARGHHAVRGHHLGAALPTIALGPIARRRGAGWSIGPARAGGQRAVVACAKATQAPARPRSSRTCKGFSNAWSWNGCPGRMRKAYTHFRPNGRPGDGPAKRSQAPGIPITIATTALHPSMKDSIERDAVRIM